MEINQRKYHILQCSTWPILNKGRRHENQELNIQWGQSIGLKLKNMIFFLKNNLVSH